MGIIIKLSFPPEPEYRYAADFPVQYPPKNGHATDRHRIRPALKGKIKMKNF